MTGNDPISANVVMVLKGYPRLSETFIAQEILGLQQAGLLLQLVSLRRPTDAAIHPVHSEIRIPVHYLPEYGVSGRPWFWPGHCRPQPP